MRDERRIVEVDHELEPAFVANWKYLDLLRSQRRMSWEEASLIWNGAVSEYIFAVVPDIDPNLVNLITEYCGSGRDNYDVRMMVYCPARAADRKDSFLQAIRYPRPLYEAREFEPALIRPVRALQALCCCTWIYAILISILFYIFATLLQPIVLFCLSILQLVWLAEDFFTESCTRFPKQLLWGVLCLLPGKLFMWAICSSYGNVLVLGVIFLVWTIKLLSILVYLLNLSICYEIKEMGRAQGIYDILYSAWRANVSFYKLSIERREHPFIAHLPPQCSIL